MMMACATPPIALCVKQSTPPTPSDRKSTRLNSSHDQISYAVFCLKKKKKIKIIMSDHIVKDVTFIVEVKYNVFLWAKWISMQIGFRYMMVYICRMTIEESTELRS